MYAPRPDPGRGRRGRPTTATAWVGRCGRDPFDLDADDGAAHDRPRPTVPGRMALAAAHSRRQRTVPYWSSTVMGRSGWRPGGRSARELGPMLTWPAGLARAGGGSARSSGPTAAAPARGGSVGQVEGELGRVVAGVEDEQRHAPASVQAANQRATGRRRSGRCRPPGAAGGHPPGRSESGRARCRSTGRAMIGWPACLEGGVVAALGSTRRRSAAGVTSTANTSGSASS